VASKDLVKRAFSVTANLPNQLKTELGHSAVNSADGDVEHGNSTAVQSERDRGAPHAPTESSPTGSVTPKTGPGSMLAFMTEQSEVHKEVVRLRERVSEFEGAEVARRLDPRRVVASKWANRDDSHFQTEAFAKLKEEIANAGGNIQPIKVRPVTVADVEGPSWEIVYGHRRHRACLELGINVLALIQNEMKDVELFVQMERENRERADLSAWEQGVMYLRALEQGLFPSAKQLGAAIDRDMSNISRAMALAKLPAEVVGAFGSPLNLQFRWATDLKDAHQRDPEGLLRASREMMARETKPTPAEIFSTLTRPLQGAGRDKGVVTQWNDATGKRTALLTTDRKGRVTVSFDLPMEESQHKKLVRSLDVLLGCKGVDSA
jgi:ParB family chromosome partitioning protein